MKVLEGSFKMVQIVQKDGFAGLWEHVKDQFADIKATVMDTIIDIIKTEAIQAGIKFILGLLTPAGAFVKAAMMIIDLVKFFIQKAAQIMELVKAITEGIKAIASGNVAAVAKAIENALGRAIPVVIGFLASLAGLGGLVDKVTGVVRKIRQRINNAIVKFWNFVKGKAKGLLGKIGFGDKKEKKKKGEDLRTTEEKKRDLEEGVREGTQLLKDNSLTSKEREKRLENIKQTYDLKELKIVTDKVERDKATVHIHGEVNPTLNGNRIVVDFDSGNPLYIIERNKLIKISGGQDKLDKINLMIQGNSSKLKDEYAEVRTALDALDSGRLSVSIGVDVFLDKGGLIKFTEIDVLTEEEMIEVKNKTIFSDAKKLSGDAYDQWLKLRDIFNDKRTVYDKNGNVIIPPKKWVYQVTIDNIDPRLKKWLLSKGMTEVREGK
ncbi:hypothetical protein B0E34_16400 [Chryseobacterium mucoviscidosis]|uniref:Uncharacterized protein n=2 Tax=Chryseobacterium mucoviscidosis TaxID=1945581 RepID=A0A202BWN9_9FLAO|nr:hypothetical protein B0E34_16400 [Chryseobacterium mucoviscidosis]